MKLIKGIHNIAMNNIKRKLCYRIRMERVGFNLLSRMNIKESRNEYQRMNIKEWGGFGLGNPEGGGASTM